MRGSDERCVGQMQWVVVGEDAVTDSKLMRHSAGKVMGNTAHTPQLQVASSP